MTNSLAGSVGAASCCGALVDGSPSPPNAYRRAAPPVSFTERRGAPARCGRCSTGSGYAVAGGFSLKIRARSRRLSTPRFAIRRQIAGCRGGEQAATPLIVSTAFGRGTVHRAGGRRQPRSACWCRRSDRSVFYCEVDVAVHLSCRPGVPSIVPIMPEARGERRAGRATVIRSVLHGQTAAAVGPRNGSREPGRPRLPLSDVRWP